MIGRVVLLERRQLAQRRQIVVVGQVGANAQRRRDHDLRISFIGFANGSPDPGQ